MTDEEERSPGPSHKRRIAFGYAALLGVAALIIAVSLPIGSRRESAPSVQGIYESESTSSCLQGEFELSQSGRYLNLEAREASGRFVLERGNSFVGDLTCAGESSVAATIEVVRSGEQPRLEGDLEATYVDDLEEGAASEGGSERERPGEERFGRLMLALAAVILAARLLGSAITRVGQPQVMGEVLAGILLGPTLLGTIAPEITDYLFPPDIIPLLEAGADIGLAFYMFLVGLELDPRMLKGRVEQAAFISHGSIAIPMALGIAVAVPIYSNFGPTDKDFLPFAVFMGVSMSITAFPVLARILLERRMFGHPVGAMAIGAAAVDDISAWGLLALATAIAGTGSGLDVIRIVSLAVLFCAAMGFLARPLLARISTAYDEAGHIPAAWTATIFVGVLLSAFVSQQIGIAAIFGAFVMGMVMPRHAGLTHDVTRRLEDFIVMVLLPLFFVVTGLKTRIGLIDRPELWAVTLALILVAVAAKWLGALGTAKFSGFDWRASAVIGALMNTRGLTELIVLSIGLELGVVTPLLFTMLVLMALATTFMTGPALRILDPRGLFSTPAARELADAVAPVEQQRSILVAPQNEKNVDALIALAKGLASSKPRREVVLARVLAPSRTTTGLATEARRLEAASREVEQWRTQLIDGGIESRGTAFTSPEPGEDLVRLSASEEIDLLLLDGRRPLVGDCVPRGEVGKALADAVCDVGVLVGRHTPDIGAARPVIVPFGGAEHDWAALEMASWIAASSKAPLKLLGREGDVLKGERDASRLLSNASLVVQQLAGIAAEPLLVPPGRQGILDASEEAGLLVIGLSDRWRDEGLGVVRAEIARVAGAPILFVRRGQRPGALAPRDEVTRFTWSSVAPAAGRQA